MYGREEKDDVVVLSGILDGFRRFGILSMASDCFRISWDIFKSISNHIERHLEHEATIEQPNALKERLAICLHRLSRGDYYYTVAEMTGNGLSIIQNITNEVCSVIVSNLWHKFVIFPESKDQMLRVIFKMESMW